MAGLDGVRGRGLLVAAALSTAAITIAATALPRSGTPPTTDAGASSVAHGLDLAAGLALACAGLAAVTDATMRTIAPLALGIAVVWFAPDWEGWDLGPSIVRSLGAVAAPALAVLVLQLALTFRRRVTLRRGARAMLGAAWTGAVAVAFCRALFRDPLLDLYCWRNCVDNTFLVDARPGLADAVDRAWTGALLALGVTTAAVAGWRLVVATRPARWILVAVLVPAALFGGAEAAYAVRLISSRLEDPVEHDVAALFAARALSASLLGAGILWTVVWARWRRSRLASLAGELGEALAAGTLQTRLATAVGDPTLEVAYWLPARQRYVDAEGMAVDVPGRAGPHATTVIVRGSTQVAVVLHDPTLVDGFVFDRELGPAARLAIENERLQAEVLAQLHDLRESRARIVTRGDAERRRLERDLHDGAQQRLLALSYDIRLASAAVEEAGAGDVDVLLAECSDHARHALDELRELAHGIYPAILAEGGLAPALASLAETAPLPVELGEIPRHRYDEAVEAAAYVTAVEAIADAVRREATFVQIAATRSDGHVRLTIDDDGRDRHEPLTHVTDRVGALAGTLDVGAKSLRAEIPCV